MAGTAPTQTQMLGILTDDHLSSSAKVIYATLDEIGQGSPVAMTQEVMADLLNLTRKTVSMRLCELRDQHLIEVIMTIGSNGYRTRAYRTRVLTLPETVEYQPRSAAFEGARAVSPLN